MSSICPIHGSCLYAKANEINIESSNVASFTLQPAVMEYVTNKLVEQVCKEIDVEKLKLLAKHALLKAQAKEYVRESQVRLALASKH